MPTAMKNRPSSSPLNGSMSASSSWRNSESASSTPARKAPSDIDRPIDSIASAAPTTSSSAAAVNISRPPCRAMNFSAGRTTSRLPTTTVGNRQQALRGRRPADAAVVRRPCGEQRQQGQQRNDRQDPGTAARRMRRGHVARRAGRARPAPTTPARSTTLPAPKPATTAAGQDSPKPRADRAQDRGRQRHLRAAEAEHRTTQHPQAARLQFESDQEQQQHHAELGELQRRLDLADQARGPTGRSACRRTGSREPRPV